MASHPANQPNPGLLLIVSGPSGGGKSTLVRELMQEGNFPIDFSVSATSRSPRPGEEDGIHYHFYSRERFEELRESGEFLEHAEVHGNLYGTPRGPVLQSIEKGRWILLEIDVQGHRQVKKAMNDAVSFFIRTPSLEEYQKRLIRRGTESPEVIARRVADATRELRDAPEYDYQIVNESIPQAVATFRTLLHGLKYERGI
jgi:guanylate kinase